MKVSLYFTIGELIEMTNVFYLIISGINFMRIQSESNERKYRKAQPGADPNDFFKNEEKGFFTQCNTLIQFIKLLQQNPDNALKLKNISEVILELQKEF